MMFSQHAVFAEPLAEDDTAEGEDQDTESEPEKTFDADTQQKETATDNTQETDDKDSDEPAPDWTVPPASTFLRFYSDEPEYLKTNSESEVKSSDSVLTSPEESIHLLAVPPTDSITMDPKEPRP